MSTLSLQAPDLISVRTSISLLSNTTITIPCGHRYCKSCIDECLNRKPVCPCCNTRLSGGVVLQRDHQYDALLEMIQKERKAADAAHLVRLVETSALCSAPTRAAPIPALLMASDEPLIVIDDPTTLASDSPVHDDADLDSSGAVTELQRVFAKHLARAVSGYVAQIQESQANKQAELSRISTDLRLRAGMDDAERLKQVAARFDKEVANTIASCDKHLERALYVPVLTKTENVAFNCYLVRGGVRICIRDLVMSPLDKVSRLIQQIQLRFEELVGDKIMSASADAGLLVCAVDSSRIVSPSTLVVKAEAGETAIPWSGAQDTLLRDYSLRPVNALLFTGALTWESECPRLCAKDSFVEGASNITNYYSCGTCKLNWICEPCREACHTGHSTVMTLRAHKPKFACCYCERGGKCCKTAAHSSR
ncbi:hypothetical protein CAOG_05164 [Capsaspora owczarzaki ATCC 30864]|uniref:Zinc finger C3HC4 RING-type domain-containing protein n=1 Tax=Capsaspora owczarzaki (strain ATCC 30864) TaxID=595528 RepID=A0A0D2UHE8_CAPO3|nr:hypothetical protein CAOG_05164 [Capsaspora owczarzaki ATCC 30864]KJE94531.1 hypothetical protein CAOG_005164 [Capsaspora owczarzaki ATCC 30864]|eukprot:XP_004346849.1 hypothetical protein CAOG_05164 [Capsaspora owczarzaki ATCC 30864]